MSDALNEIQTAANKFLDIKGVRSVVTKFIQPEPYYRVTVNYAETEEGHLNLIYNVEEELYNKFNTEQSLSIQFETRFVSPTGPIE